MSSVPSAEAERIDPDNTLLHRLNVRRLEAEAIRDALLALSGRLVVRDVRTERPGPPDRLHGGRGRPASSGPLDGDGRRSLYLAVRRNFLNPMFLAFDAPVPFSCMGRRNASNVPAQALILLNDPLVLQQAKAWAARLLERPGRIRPRAARAALRSAPSAARRPRTKRGACLDFLGRSGWADLCHVLINMKEFIFID